ncbi:site-specific DNA-methyltransferase [Sphingomonas phyllosphaerae]|uniref:site-specific DNA-methyltransferase n=1 Tax=Sphingomonas phyllosphaerae TaxID=257003 RepID=UPI0003B5C357|nr:DNA methyltransferase [Sphingomonas phyllosphaerae]
MKNDTNKLMHHIIDPLKVELRPIGTLKPAKRNARRHSEQQIEQVASSIRQFGFTNPIIIDAGSEIVAGHARYEAARLLKIDEVPTLPVAWMTPAELRAYRLADNKIATNADWDPEILKMEFEDLQLLDLPFELEVTGFSTTEIDLAVDFVPSQPKLDAVPELARREVTGVERGDLWLLGPHRLLSGDSRDPASFELLMDGTKARMVFSDPPFNVKVDGHVGGLGQTKHEEFAFASGEMSSSEFTGFLQTVFANAAAVSQDGAIHYQCMDWRHMDEMLMAGRQVYSGLQNLCVWAKDNGGMGSFYRSQHELVFVWKVGTEPHLNTVQLGKNGRYRTNVWNYRGATKTGKDAELAMHPTVKPVTMIIDAIKDTSKRGEIVLDPFGGSGSTLLAAHKAGRHARLIEYEPKFCAVTIRRWQDLAGADAMLAATGETFEIAHARRNAEMDRIAEEALA